MKLLKHVDSIVRKRELGSLCGKLVTVYCQGPEEYYYSLRCFDLEDTPFVLHKDDVILLLSIYNTEDEEILDVLPGGPDQWFSDLELYGNTPSNLVIYRALLNDKVIIFGENRGLFRYSFKFTLVE